MKKPFLLLLALSSLAISAFAQNTLTRKDYVTRIETCEAILREFMLRPTTAIPSDILQRARGIVVTNQIKAGFIFGVKDGYGIVMVRRPDGSWSVPAFVNAGEASLGLQLGATTVETVYVIMDDETPRLLYKQRFNVGADAKAVAGPRVADSETYNRAILATPVLVYTKTAGLYAGATVKAGYLSRNDNANRAFYNTSSTLPEILYSDWITPPAEVQPLMAYVDQITR
jgi:lipid-binding SYLF domain-containing protein